jgi:hypothetical protein
MLGTRILRSAAIAGVVVLAAGRAAAFDFQRFASLRGAGAAARAADSIGLAALESFDGPDLVGGDGPMARAGIDLALLFHEHADYVTRGRPGVFAASSRDLRLDSERVLIEAVAADNSLVVLAALEALGLADGTVFGRIVSGWLPIAALDAASRAPNLQFMHPSYAVASTGSVTSQGDVALAAASARQAYGVTGAGVTVGVISDSFNCLNGYALDMAAADLPGGVTVLQERADCASATDEGRAMLQIVHDLAPGAALAFHSGFNGTASFAAGIETLVSQAAADVVVDDVSVLTAPMFQDGPIAQAIDSVVALGATYFSAAGNSARQSYESTFVATNVNGAVGKRHDFIAGAGTDTLQSLRLSAGARAYVVLQWDQPFFSVSGGAGATSDLDLVLYDDGTPFPTPLTASGWANVGGDAVDILLIENLGGSEITRQLAIERRNSVSPGRIKYIVFALAGSVTALEHATNSATVFGHANAAGGRAVGAANYAQTPAFGTQPAVLAPYSSRGGTTILLSSAGTPVAIARRKPELVAADGVDTRFFGSGDTDATGYPNFYGTSAAAPHVAGIAALARSLDTQATPGTVYAALLESAFDMGVAGYDDESGTGLIQADRALAAISANAAAGVALGFAATPAGTPLLSPFAADQFATLGVLITDNDAAPNTSQTAAVGAGSTGPFAGAFLYVPSGAATWIEIVFTPTARDIRFDFATPAGPIAIAGYDGSGNLVSNTVVTGTTPIVGPDTMAWLAGSAALPSALFLRTLRIAPTTTGAPLAIDNLRFTTATELAGADVPIPLPTLLAAALLVVGTGYRRLVAATAARVEAPNKRC